MSLKNATKQENSRVELEIEVGAEAFAAAVDAAYKKDVKKMAVPGFRKGKAPLDWFVLQHTAQNSCENPPLLIHA